MSDGVLITLIITCGVVTVVWFASRMPPRPPKDTRGLERGDVKS